MDNLSPDFVPGPRCGAGSRAGAFQFPALASSGGQVIDCSAWTLEYIRITWVPAAAADMLFYGFFATAALAAAGFDETTDSSGSPTTIVPTAPDVLATGSIDVGVPGTHPFLRVEPSAGSGRCQVRNAGMDKQF